MADWRLGDPSANNPWDQLPSYWNAEVAAVLAMRAVPEPASAILLLAGMVPLLVMRRRAGTTLKTSRKPHENKSSRRLEIGRTPHD